MLFFELQKKYPDIEESNIKAWGIKGIPNLEKNIIYAENALLKAKNGDISYLSSSASDLKGLSRDVDHIGGFGRWWKELDSKYEERFYKAFKASHYTAFNIYYTEREFWEDDEILNEMITGYIDEQELLNYLQEGEKLEDLK